MSATVLFGPPPETLFTITSFPVWFIFSDTICPPVAVVSWIKMSPLGADPTFTIVSTYSSDWVAMLFCRYSGVPV
ncbi:MAG TPA: hypothetical protein VNB52_04175, partial [Ilumatobacteraceae bacterium]|nr:hypothetical protein [Ilumatobacteraceae bacterium]